MGTPVPTGEVANASWVNETTAELAEDLIKVRRDLHAHPELGRDEVRTTTLVRDYLIALGLDPRVLSVGTGVICDVLPAGAPTADLLALRADLDALPLTDTKTAPYASTVPGVGHVCGHDVHTTILLGTAAVLVAARRAGRLTRGVRLIFQPAEEASPSGALDVIDEGSLTPVAEAYALHCDPTLTVGQIGLRTGPITSAVDHVVVEVTGPGGHTSRPHLSADLIGGLGALATELPLLLSRRVDPRGAISLIWGQISAGSASNAIPGAGVLSGTLRCLDPDVWRAARGLLADLADQVLRPWGDLNATVTMVGLPPTVNDPDSTARLTSAAAAVLGETSIAPTPQSLGGEDFGLMLEQVPGAIARLGVRPPGAADWPDLHRGDFDVDEDAIAVGVRLLAGVALR